MARPQAPSSVTVLGECVADAFTDPGRSGPGELAFWGRNSALEPPPLIPGDTVTMTVEGIGTLSNTVVEGVAPVPLPPARRRQ